MIVRLQKQKTVLLPFVFIFFFTLFSEEVSAYSFIQKDNIPVNYSGGSATVMDELLHVIYSSPVLDDGDAFRKLDVKEQIKALENYVENQKKYYDLLFETIPLVKDEGGLSRLKEGFREEVLNERLFSKRMRQIFKDEDTNVDVDVLVEKGEKIIEGIQENRKKGRAVEVIFNHKEEALLSNKILFLNKEILRSIEKKDRNQTLHLLTSAYEITGGNSTIYDTLLALLSTSDFNPTDYLFINHEWIDTQTEINNVDKRHIDISLIHELKGFDVLITEKEVKIKHLNKTLTLKDGLILFENREVGYPEAVHEAGGRLTVDLVFLLNLYGYRVEIDEHGILSAVTEVYPIHILDRLDARDIVLDMLLVTNNNLVKYN